MAPKDKPQALDKKALTAQLNEYCVANNTTAILELIVTLAAFAASFALMTFGLKSGQYWLMPFGLIPGGILLVRIFTIQHDCGHGSYFTSEHANDTLGCILGTITLAPYYYWRKNHNVHHAFSGNLERRGIGDVDTFTVKEYKELPFLKRTWYRLYRNPYFLLIVAPLALFVVKHRIPLDNPFHSWKSWNNIMLTNLGVAAIITAIVYFGGWDVFWYVMFPITWLGSSLGVLIFYMQHQYEDMYWRDHKDWSYFDAGYKGSAYFEFGRFPSWLICNINIHHIHHLNSRIPFYRLRECLEGMPDMQDVPKRTYKDIPSGLMMALWDEDKQKMVRFSDL